MTEPARPSRTLKVISAQRQKPLGQTRPLKDRLQNAIADHGLNAVSIVRESLQGLRRADRHFKTKALIVGAWLVLTFASLVVAYPGSVHRGGNALGAQL